MLWRRTHTATTKTTCTHPKALPRWENVEDVGNEQRATHYFCSDCGAFLPPPVASPR